MVRGTPETNGDIQVRKFSNYFSIWAIWLSSVKNHPLVVCGQAVEKGANHSARLDETSFHGSLFLFRKRVLLAVSLPGQGGTGAARSILGQCGTPDHWRPGIRAIRGGINRHDTAKGRGPGILQLAFSFAEGGDKNIDTRLEVGKVALQGLQLRQGPLGELKVFGD